MSLEDIIVLDAGSCTFDAGFAANIPSDTEPSVVRPHGTLTCWTPLDSFHS